MENGTGWDRLLRVIGVVRGSDRNRSRDLSVERLRDIGMVLFSMIDKMTERGPPTTVDKKCLR